jgi:hypothetical protein
MQRLFEKAGKVTPHRKRGPRPFRLYRGRTPLFPSGHDDPWLRGGVIKNPAGLENTGDFEENEDKKDDSCFFSTACLCSIFPPNSSRLFGFFFFLVR